jgi:chemotaxis protein methyltransferase CheR
VSDILVDFTPESSFQLSEKEFRLISGLVQDRFGVNLTEKKKALIKGRLNSMMRSEGFSTFEDLYESVVGDVSGRGLLSLIDRLSTNHSYFFRESDHFDFLINNVLPAIRPRCKGRNSGLKIWSAGCAAGEEAYTIAMTLFEHLGSEVHNTVSGILGTDISMSALERAVEGIFPEHKLDRLPAELRRYFKKKPDGLYEIDDKVKRMVLFKRLNLMGESYPFKGKFDVIFCRNVMIYFDQKTKLDLVRKFRNYLHDGGYLFIGHSETLGRNSEGYEYIKPTVYRKW